MDSTGPLGSRLCGVFTPLTQTPGSAPELAHQQPNHLETQLDEQPRQKTATIEAEAEANDGTSLKLGCVYY